MRDRVADCLCLIAGVGFLAVALRRRLREDAVRLQVRRIADAGKSTPIVGYRDSEAGDVGAVAVRILCRSRGRWRWRCRARDAIHNAFFIVDRQVGVREIDAGVEDGDGDRRHAVSRRPSAPRAIGFSDIQIPLVHGIRQRIVDDVNRVRAD